LQGEKVNSVWGLKGQILANENEPFEAVACSTVRIQRLQ
jgi:hypothetical protein